MRSVVTLAAGSALAQFITLALMPVITRLYDPTAFGVFAVFVAIATLVTSISNLRFAEVIVLAPTDEDADAAAELATLVVATIALFCGVLGALFADPLAAVFGIESYSFFLQLVFIGVFLGGLRQILRRWLLREHFNRYIAFGEISQALVDRSCTILAYWIAPGTPIGLVLGRLLGQLAGVAALAKPLLSRRLSVGFGSEERGRMAAIGRDYRQFPKYSWGVMVDNAAKQLPVVFVTGLLGPAAAGYYALARRVLAEPAIIMGAALGQSYYQLAVKEGGGDAVRRATVVMTSMLLKLIALPLMVGLLCAPELFALLFGESWRPAGWYALLLSPVFMLYLILRPLNKIFDLKMIQRAKGMFALQNVSVISLSFLPGFFIDDALFVLSSYSLLTSLFLLNRGLWLLGRMDISAGEVVHACSIALVLAAAAAGLSVMSRRFWDGSDLLIILAVVGSVALYLAMLAATDKPVRALFYKLLGKV
jgi:O-antigen/teichoic acid export membrane protein